MVEILSTYTVFGTAAAPGGGVGTRLGDNQNEGKIVGTPRYNQCHPRFLLRDAWMMFLFVISMNVVSALFDGVSVEALGKHGTSIFLVALDARENASLRCRLRLLFFV